MKITKEDLLKENAILKSRLEEVVELEKNRKKDFARAFYWFERGVYNSNESVRTPTWGEILIEVGKLIAARTFMDFDGNVSELEVKVEKLEKKVYAEEPMDLSKIK